MAFYDHPRLSRPVPEPSDIIQQMAQCEGIEPPLAFQPGNRLPSGPITTLATLQMISGAGRRCRPPWPCSHPQLSKLVPEPSDITRLMEVPARFERAIADLQSAALTNLAMEPCGTEQRI